ncbi:MAG: DUF4625 domain-containing protein [Bacteroidetes bacterium]|nr:DUF4625 domain-containing protein [Bacteroidota bacterium]
MKIFLASAALLALTFSACKKHDEDKDAPVISIASPASNQMFKVGDTVHITGTVTDHSLHEFHGMIHNTDSADKTVWEYMPTVHDLEKFDFDQIWVVPAVRDTCDMKLHLEVHDHDENQAEKMVMFRIRP